MANKACRIAYCAQCNAYREHDPEMEQVSLVGYRCLTCGHHSDLSERCRHTPACVVSGAKGANTPPEMWLRLGEEQGASIGEARAERRRRDDRRNAILTASIIGGGALVLILICVVCGYLNWQHK
jgi:hypothetical protein